jgi:hypothetical protein
MAEKYSAEQVASAITDARGILAVAARRLGCSRTTVHRYVNQYATVKAAYEEASETVLDFAESKLYEQVNEGNITAIIYLLKTKGKSRGYVERSELSGPNGGPVETKTIGDEGHHRAISALADAIRESIPGARAAADGDMGSAKQAPVAGVSFEG